MQVQRFDALAVESASINDYLSSLVNFSFNGTCAGGNDNCEGARLDPQPFFVPLLSSYITFLQIHKLHILPHDIVIYVTLYCKLPVYL